MTAEHVDWEADRIWRVINPLFASNTYICATDKPGECFIIDPGLNGELIERTLAELELKPSHVLCTHGHFDHVGSAAFFQRKYGASVYLHGDDIPTIKAANFLLMAFKLPNRIEMPEIEQVVHDGFTVPIGNKLVRYHTTPGHTPGSSMIQFQDSVFSGDTLYSRSMGLSRLPGEDRERLRHSLLAVWDRFPLGSTVYPGHGEAASFGWIKRNNRRLIEFVEGKRGQLESEG